jgi:hypothetical protein
VELANTLAEITKLPVKLADALAFLYRTISGAG